MAEWKELEPAIVEIVGKLPANSYLVLRDGGCLLQFALLDSDAGAVLRAEVCRDSPEDELRLRSKGWELVDTWSGLWRRDIPAGAGSEAVQGLVRETIFAVRSSFGVRQPDGFTYLSWQEASPRAAWQFWKPNQDKELKWPGLGLQKDRDQTD